MVLVTNIDKFVTLIIIQSLITIIIFNTESEQLAIEVVIHGCSKNFIFNNYQII